MGNLTCLDIGKPILNNPLLHGVSDVKAVIIR
jgi:hypothetical protein